MKGVRPIFMSGGIVPGFLGDGRVGVWPLAGSRVRPWWGRVVSRAGPGSRAGSLEFEPPEADGEGRADPEDAEPADADDCCHHPPLHPAAGQVDHLEDPRMKFGSHRLPGPVAWGRWRPPRHTFPRMRQRANLDGGWGSNHSHMGGNVGRGGFLTRGRYFFLIGVVFHEKAAPAEERPGRQRPGVVGERSWIRRRRWQTSACGGSSRRRDRRSRQGWHRFPVPGW